MQRGERGNCIKGFSRILFYLTFIVFVIKKSQISQFRAKITKINPINIYTCENLLINQINDTKVCKETQPQSHYFYNSGTSSTVGKHLTIRIGRFQVQIPLCSIFLKAVFHKFYLVHSWILCPIYTSGQLCSCFSYIFSIQQLWGGMGRLVGSLELEGNQFKKACAGLGLGTHSHRAAGDSS